jgi:hypothetical protein
LPYHQLIPGFGVISRMTATSPPLHVRVVVWSEAVDRRAALMVRTVVSVRDAAIHDVVGRELLALLHGQFVGDSIAFSAH